MSHCAEIEAYSFPISRAGSILNLTLTARKPGVLPPSFLPRNVRELKTEVKRTSRMESDGCACDLPQRGCERPCAR